MSLMTRDELYLAYSRGVISYAELIEKLKG